MDLSVFKSIKSSWDQRLCTWTRNHKQNKLPKKEFTKIVSEIWIELDKGIIINGFKKAGIHPFNKMVINRTKFDPLSLKRWDGYLITVSNNNCDNQVASTSHFNITKEQTKASTSQLEDQTTPNTNINSDLIPSSQSFEELLLNVMKQSDVIKTTTKRKVGYVVQL